MCNPLTPSPPSDSPSSPPPPPPIAPLPPVIPIEFGFRLLTIFFRGFVGSLNYWHECKAIAPLVTRTIEVPRDVFDNDILTLQIAYTTRVNLDHLKLNYQFYFDGEVYDEATMTLPPLSAHDSFTSQMVMFSEKTAFFRNLEVPHHKLAIKLWFFEGQKLLNTAQICVRNRRVEDPPVVPYVAIDRDFPPSNESLRDFLAKRYEIISNNLPATNGNNGPPGGNNHSSDDATEVNDGPFFNITRFNLCKYFM